MDASGGAEVKQGKVTGVIIPPPDIRAVVDKTAQFVARNGKSFEERIMNSSEGKTAKFNFMKPFDPYHAYYEFKIREFEEGVKNGAGTDGAAATTTTEGVAAPIQPSATTTSSSAATTTAATATTSSSTTTVKATITTPIARFAMNKPTEAPPPFEFSLGHPAGLSSVDVDIIKLTAQYTAVNGREFLGGLAQREQRNPQFDFLKPTHILFSYFTSLVDGYAKILTPTGEMKENITNKSNRMKALEASVQRWEWTRSEEDRKKRDSMEADAERQAFQAIDWFEFTVVETIDFAEDELLEIPGMLGFGFGDSSSGGVGTVTEGVDEDMDMDMDEDEDEDDKAKITTVATTTTTTTANRGFRRLQQLRSSIEEGDDMDTEMETETAEPEPEPEPEVEESDLNIVSDYTPRISANVMGELEMIDPISGKAIPASEMSEHMRVQLLDPRWRQQQQRFQEKQRETSYAEGGSIADSLKSFARNRGDIFSANKSSADTVKKGANDVEGGDADMGENNEEDAWQPTTANSSLNLPLPQSSIQPIPRPPTMSIPKPMPTPMPMPMPMPVPVPVQQSFTNIPPPPPVMSTLSTILPRPMMQIPPPSSIPIPLPHLPPPLQQVPVQQVIPPPPRQTPTTTTGVAPPAPAPGNASSSSSSSSSSLLSADEFAAKFPDPIKLSLSIPNESSNSNWNFNGQIIPIEISVTSTIKELKELLSSSYLNNMPINKIQIKSSISGFLKDVSTLAVLNIGDGFSLDLSAKTRGGKK